VIYVSYSGKQWFYGFNRIFSQMGGNITNTGLIQQIQLVAIAGWQGF